MMRYWMGQHECDENAREGCRVAAAHRCFSYFLLEL